LTQHFEHALLMLLEKAFTGISGLKNHLEAFAWGKAPLIPSENLLK